MTDNPLTHTISGRAKNKSHKASGTTSPPGELPDALWLSRGNLLNTAQAPRSTPEVQQATTASRLDGLAF